MWDDPCEVEMGHAPKADAPLILVGSTKCCNASSTDGDFVPQLTPR